MFQNILYLGMENKFSYLYQELFSDSSIRPINDIVVGNWKEFGFILLGAGNCSSAIALAAWIKGPVVASDIEGEQMEFYHAKHICLEEIASCSNVWKDEERLPLLRELLSLQKMYKPWVLSPIFLPTFTFHWADAKNSKELLSLADTPSIKDRKTKVWWFQCPYAGKTTTGNLIKEFFDAARVIPIGSYIFLGIVIGEYDYGDVKHFDGFKRIGQCKDFIKGIIQRGYRHYSKFRDIHNSLLNKHFTIIYERMPDKNLDTDIDTLRNDFEHVTI